MSARPAVVSADHLSRWFGTVSALSDVTVDVPGGITALLGPNGAGKSTLLKLVTGQMRPSRGAVKVLGEVAFGNAGLYQRVGLAPEHDGFYEGMTGREWVSALLTLHGGPGSDVEVATGRALDSVGLDEVADRRIGTYSRGMRQRLKLAQAMAHQPDLLVLDEPLSGLDPLSRRHIMSLLRDWAATGRSVLLSSHVLHEVEALTGNIVLLHQGRVLAEGDIHEVRALIDAHPHQVLVRAREPRALVERLAGQPGVLSVRLSSEAVTVETSMPDDLYDLLTALAADAAPGEIQGVSSPDDTLQAVFSYLVRQ